MNNDCDISLSEPTSKRSTAARASTSALTPIIEMDSHPVAKTEAKGFTMPVDPLRVIDAVFKYRWLALLTGLILGGVLGYTGWKRYSVHHTVIALMRSGAVMEKAVQNTEGKQNESIIRAGLTIAPERNTDMIRVTMNSDVNGAAALASLRAYIDSVLTISRDVQKRDAAEMNSFLQQQLTQVDHDLLKINEELLAYAKREHLVDADKQTDAWLGELGSYTLKYENLRLDFETLDLKIAGQPRSRQAANRPR